MKKNFFYGIMLAVAFLLSSASFASPLTDAAYTEPVYNMAIDPRGPGDPSPASMDAPVTLAVMRMYRTMYAHTETKSNPDYQTTACGYQDAPVEDPLKPPISI